MLGGLSSVFLVCEGPQCPPERWLGEYVLAGEVHGRPSYRHKDGDTWWTNSNTEKKDVRAKQLAGDAALLQPLMWSVPQLGWFVGSAEHLGERRGSIFARAPQAATPNAVSSVWTTALGTSNGSMPLPNLRCVGDTEGLAAMAAMLGAKRAVLANGAGTVYFTPRRSDNPKFDRLRSSWVGVYRRLKDPNNGNNHADEYWIVNDRYVYERVATSTSASGPSSKTSRALWFAGDSWFIGYREHVGQPRGIFHARDLALQPEKINTQWLIAGSAASKQPAGSAGSTQLSVSSLDWVDAPDLAVISGDEGKQALTRYKAQLALRASKLGRRMGLNHAGKRKGAHPSDRLRGSQVSER